jgi:RNA polymerase sigma-70 factor (ECF subfamily)
VHDQATLRRIAAGEAAALADLYDRHTPLLYAVVQRILREPAEAEDVMQEVWLQVWKRPHTYDADRGSVEAWLITIARSRALDRYRSRTSRRRAEEKAPEPQPAKDQTSAPPSRVLDDALRDLEDHHRRVLELAYWEGLSQREIAERMASPLGTVKSWTRQGLERLRGRFPAEELK